MIENKTLKYVRVLCCPRALYCLFRLTEEDRLSGVVHQGDGLKCPFSSWCLFMKDWSQTSTGREMAPSHSCAPGRSYCLFCSLSQGEGFPPLPFVLVHPFLSRTMIWSSNLPFSSVFQGLLIFLGEHMTMARLVLTRVRLHT